MMKTFSPPHRSRCIKEEESQTASVGWDIMRAADDNMLLARPLSHHGCLVDWILRALLSYTIRIALMRTVEARAPVRPILLSSPGGCWCTTKTLMKLAVSAHIMKRVYNPGHHHGPTPLLARVSLITIIAGQESWNSRWMEWAMTLKVLLKSATAKKKEKKTRERQAAFFFFYFSPMAPGDIGRLGISGASRSHWRPALLRSRFLSSMAG